MYIKNKSRYYLEPWGTPASVLAQDEIWLLKTTICFLFLKKKSVKRLNQFPDTQLRLNL